MVLHKNLIANYLGQFWTTFIGLIFVPIYIKYLGIEAYGLVGLYTMLQIWFGYLDLGLTPTISREFSKFIAGELNSNTMWNLIYTIELLTIIIASITVLICIAGSGWIAEYWINTSNGINSIGNIKNVLIVIGFVISIKFIEGIYRNALISLQKQITYNVINSAFATLRSVGALFVLSKISNSIFYFFIWQAIISLISMLFFRIYTYSSLPPKTQKLEFSIDVLKKNWKFTGGIILSNFTIILITQTDKIILSKVLSLTELSIYSIATTVSGTIYLVLNPITTAFAPKLTEQLFKVNSNSSLSEIYHKYSQFVSVMCSSVAFVIMINSSVLLEIWLKNDEVVSMVQPLLIPMIVSVLLICFLYPAKDLQYSYGWSSLTFKVNLISLFLVLPALIIVVPKYKILGAIFIHAILHVSYLIFVPLIMHNKILINEKFNWYFYDVILPTLGSIIGAMTMCLLIPDTSNVLLQFIYVAFSLIFSIFVSILFSNKIRVLLFSQIRNLIRF